MCLHARALVVPGSRGHGIKAAAANPRLNLNTIEAIRELPSRNPSLVIASNLQVSSSIFLCDWNPFQAEFKPRYFDYRAF